MVISCLHTLHTAKLILVVSLQVDLNQAITMVCYYSSSSEPAQIRGKTVYIQYSNRHEIVNNKGPGDVPGNVLLVTIEGVEPADISIDVIHLVIVLNFVSLSCIASKKFHCMLNPMLEKSKSCCSLAINHL